MTIRLGINKVDPLTRKKKKRVVNLRNKRNHSMRLHNESDK